jgi:hypothetical protein
VDKCWVDCDRSTVAHRYHRLARFIPLFDRLLFLPPSLRRSAVEHLPVARWRQRGRNRLRHGNNLLELTHADFARALLVAASWLP